MHGTVARVEIRHEKHPGIDDVYLVEIGGRTFHLDSAIASRLTQGDLIKKKGWSRSMKVNAQTVRLRVSPDFKGMLVAMPLMVLIAFVLTAVDSSR